MNFFSKPLNEMDKEISSAIDQELSRQQNQIELIAFETMFSDAINSIWFC